MGGLRDRNRKCRDGCGVLRKDATAPSAPGVSFPNGVREKPRPKLVLNPRRTRRVIAITGNLRFTGAVLRWGLGQGARAPKFTCCPQIQKLADRSDVISVVTKRSNIQIFRGSALPVSWWAGGSLPPPPPPRTPPPLSALQASFLRVSGLTHYRVGNPTNDRFQMAYMKLAFFFGFGELRKWTRWWRDWWGHCLSPRIFGLEPPLQIQSLTAVYRPIHTSSSMTVVLMIIVVPEYIGQARNQGGGSERADDPPSVGKRSAFAGERRYSSMQ